MINKIDVSCAKDRISFKPLGAVQRKNIPKIRDYYGSGWVGPGLTWNFLFFENHPKVPLNQYRYFGVVAEWLRAWDTLTMFEATVCGRSHNRMSFSSCPGDW